MELKDLEHLVSLKRAYDMNVDQYNQSRSITGFQAYYNGYQSRHFNYTEPEGRQLRETFIRHVYNRVIESAKALSAAGVTVKVEPIDLEIS